MSFRTILVPVDFSLCTEIAVRKAMEVADSGASTIVLLHVINDTLYDMEAEFKGKPADNAVPVRERVEEQMNFWHELISTENTALKIVKMIASGSVQTTIESKARELNADLVVIGKKSNHSWFPFLNTVVPSDIAEQTGCAVLTVKPGSKDRRPKSVVVPVGKDVPYQKMQALLVLCKKFRLKVHLVTFSGHSDIPSDVSTTPLLKVYQWLRQSAQCDVSYAVLQGSQKTRAVLNYSEQVDADVLLVYPDSETRIGWMNRHISDLLPASSGLQVLAVKPAIS